jgi:DNA-directed RNA polymerase specialized sigma24 family protein
MEIRGDVKTESAVSGSDPAVALRRRWALTRAAFDELLAALNADRDEAGERYLEMRGNLLRFFEWRGCPFPEEHADETINRVARRLSEGEAIRDPAQYSIGVARMLLLEIHKERARERRALSELTDPDATTSEFEDPEQRVECLESCLASLSAGNRELILQYYQGEKGSKIENRKRLAERFGAEINTLRMRALRLREKLQGCVENCLQKKL